MKLILAALAATALVAPLAHAGESITAAGDTATDTRNADHVYIATGVGIDGGRRAQFGVNVDAGVRLPYLPIWAHGYAAAGESGFLSSSGTFQQVRGGLEARGCLSGRLLCGFAGVDVGYNSDIGQETPFFNPEMDYAEHDLVTAPRFGVEIGNRLRGRLELSIPIEKNLDDGYNNRPLTTGVALHAGVGYSF